MRLFSVLTCPLPSLSIKGQQRERAGCYQSLISQNETAGSSLHLSPPLPFLCPALSGRDGGGGRLRRPDQPQRPPDVRHGSVRGERYIQPLLSLVELLHYCALIGRELHSDASPALLCHKEPAQGTQSPLLGSFLPIVGSLWQKNRRLPSTERIYY